LFPDRNEHFILPGLSWFVAAALHDQDQPIVKDLITPEMPDEIPVAE
jgi:hypothetical protein